MSRHYIVGRHRSNKRVVKNLHVAVGSSGGGELYVLPISGSPSGIFMVPAIGMAQE
jgi:hypothetical protein